jgi:hypothetical protein
LTHEADADKVSLTTILDANAGADEFLKVARKFVARAPQPRFAPCLKNSRQGRVDVPRRHACKAAGGDESV